MLIGKRAGRVNHAYRAVSVKGKEYMEHRVIFMFHHGYFPEEVDHIDGNKSNNRIENLRECTDSENSQNRGLSVLNNSGTKGVSFDKETNKWRSTIKINGKQILLLLLNQKYLKF